MMVRHVDPVEPVDPGGGLGDGGGGDGGGESVPPPPPPPDPQYVTKAGLSKLSFLSQSEEPESIRRAVHVDAHDTQLVHVPASAVYEHVTPAVHELPGSHSI